MGFTVDHLKAIASVVVWSVTILGNALPMRITAAKWASRAESLAGGVFIGAGLAHLLVESCLELQVYSYPVAPAIACGTFALLTFVELFTYTEHDANVFGEGGESESEFAVCDSDSPPEYKPAEMFGTTNKHLTTATITLYVIMGVHSVIEGLTIGILPKWSNVIAVCCAVIGHKPVEAFSLSLILLKDKPTKCAFWALAVVYSLLSPVTSVVAMYVADSLNEKVDGYIGAFSAGTFIFVGCHQWACMVEHKQKHNNREKLWHFGMFSGGLAWMLLVAIIEAVT